MLYDVFSDVQEDVKVLVDAAYKELDGIMIKEDSGLKEVKKGDVICILLRPKAHFER